MLKCDLIQKIKDINAKIAPSAHKNEAVGLVFDKSSTEINPIALIVGINYGQYSQNGSSRKFIDSLKDDPQDNVNFAKLISCLAKKENLPAIDYGVTLWNFYPYLTAHEWTKNLKNSKAEAEKIFDEGYNDIISTFTTVVESLNPQLIVFHGITSAVPILARVSLRAVKRSGFLVPNLSRGLAKEKISKIK